MVSVIPQRSIKSSSWYSFFLKKKKNYIQLVPFYHKYLFYIIFIHNLQCILRKLVALKTSCITVLNVYKSYFAIINTAQSHSYSPKLAS